MGDLKSAEQKSMASVFDRPTPYALNALAVIASTKANLRADLYFREFGKGIPAWKYLKAQILGGPRKPKRFEKALIAAGIMKSGEYAVPGKGVPLDAYGNIPGRFYVQLLSALGASSDRTQNRNRSKKTRKPRADFFVVRTRGKAGVYQRKGRDIVPVLIFVGAPGYRPRLPYYETAQITVPPAFRRHMQQSFNRYVLPEIRKAS